MLGCDWAGLVDAQWDSRSDILPPGVKNRILKNNNSLTWHGLIWKKMWTFISTHLSHLCSRILCAKFGWNWPSGSLRRRFLKVVNVFFYVAIIFPWKKCMALNLNKFEFPLPKNTLCHVWLKIAQWFWRRFSKVVNIFFQFLLLSSLRKRARSFIWKKLNSLNPRMICAKFGWNWSGGCRE